MCYSILLVRYLCLADLKPESINQISCEFLFLFFLLCIFEKILLAQTQNGLEQAGSRADGVMFHNASS